MDPNSDPEINVSFDQPVTDSRYQRSLFLVLFLNCDNNKKIILGTGISHILKIENMLTLSRLYQKEGQSYRENEKKIIDSHLVKNYFI